MLSGWRKHQYLRVAALLLMAFFAVATATDAVVCQKITDESGNCLLPCLCCQVAGAVNASPIIHVEYVTPYTQVPVAMAPVITVSAFFHPPRA